MNEFEKKILKFGLALVVIFILNDSVTVFLPFIKIYLFKNIDLDLKITWLAYGIILNLLLGILLFYDCRKKIPNYILISILGGVAPVVGLMFYFIEKFSLSKIRDHAK